MSISSCIISATHSPTMPVLPAFSRGISSCIIRPGAPPPPREAPSQKALRTRSRLVSCPDPDRHKAVPAHAPENKGWRDVPPPESFRRQQGELMHGLLGQPLRRGQADFPRTGFQRRPSSPPRLHVGIPSLEVGRILLAPAILGQLLASLPASQTSACLLPPLHPTVRDKVPAADHTPFAHTWPPGHHAPQAIVITVITSVASRAASWPPRHDPPPDKPASPRRARPGKLRSATLHSAFPAAPTPRPKPTHPSQKHTPLLLAKAYAYGNASPLPLPAGSHFTFLFSVFHVLNKPGPILARIGPQFEATNTG